MNNTPTAVITGGTKGIGQALTEMLIRRGYQVITSYAHDDTAARALQSQYPLQLHTCKADHTDRTQTYRFLDYIKSHTNTVHCVISNAGTTIRKPLQETLDTDWDQMMEVTVNTPFILLRELYPLISPDSRILFTGSAMGIYPHATSLGYGTTKAALHALARNLVKHFEPKATTVNVIAPGFVETQWQKDKPQHIRQNICKKTALHRFATLQEITSAYELCLDNPFINGSVIEVNGGYNYL